MQAMDRRTVWAMQLRQRVSRRLAVLDFARLDFARLGVAGLGVGALIVGTMLTVRNASALSLVGARSLDRAGRGGSQGYLGINFRDLTDDQVAALKLRDAHGAEIVLIDHDGPASKSGLREHDVIVQMNGQSVEGEEQLRRMLRETPPGRMVAFVISRDGQQQTISTQLANRETVGQEAWDRHITVPEPSEPGEASSHGNGFLGGGGATVQAPRHGFLGTATLSSSYTGALLEMMGPQLADFFGAQSGLLVQAVDPNSPAAIAGMRAGDVVVKIDTMMIARNADWLRIVHENRGKPLSVMVLRDKRERILTLTPEGKKRSGVILRLWPGSKVHGEPSVGMVRPGPLTE